MTYAELFARVTALTTESVRIEVGTWRYMRGHVETEWSVSVIPRATGARVIIAKGPTAEMALARLVELLGVPSDPTGASDAVGDASVSEAP
jgi:hypothetical protein